MYNYFTINNKSITSWQMNLLNLLSPNGRRPPASRTLANNGVPVVGVSASCEDESSGFTNRSQQWCTPSWAFRVVRGGIFRGNNRFRPRLIGVVDIKKAFVSEDGIVCSPSAGGFTNPSQSATSQWGWGFHTVRGGIDPEYHRFDPTLLYL